MLLKANKSWYPDIWVSLTRSFLNLWKWGACISHVLVLCHISQASHTHDAIAEAAQLMKEAVDDIMVTLNEAASEVGMVGGMVESIADAMAKVSAAGYSVSSFGSEATE